MPCRVSRTAEGYTVTSMLTRHPDDRESAFTSHLEELRARLLASMLAVMVGIVAGWFLFPPAYRMVCQPIIEIVRAQGGTVMTLGLAESFFTRIKLASVLGLILASPFVLWQLWAFIAPGLTPRERRVAGPIVPVICLLFLLGAALAYLVIPKVAVFFLGYTLESITPNLMFVDAINFPLKLMVAFGLGFQLPVVLLGLVLLRILTPRLLLRQWRAAILVIALLAAVITPTADPVTMLMLMLPMCLLYFGTVLIAYRVVKPEAEEAA